MLLLSRLSEYQTKKSQYDALLKQAPNNWFGRRPPQSQQPGEGIQVIDPDGTCRRDGSAKALMLRARGASQSVWQLGRFWRDG